METKEATQKHINLLFSCSPDSKFIFRLSTYFFHRRGSWVPTYSCEFRGNFIKNFFSLGLKLMSYQIIVSRFHKLLRTVQGATLKSFLHACSINRNLCVFFWRYLACKSNSMFYNIFKFVSYFQMNSCDFYLFCFFFFPFGGKVWGLFVCDGKNSFPSILPDDRFTWVIFGSIAICYLRSVYWELALLWRGWLYDRLSEARKRASQWRGIVLKNKEVFSSVLSSSSRVLCVWIWM